MPTHTRCLTKCRATCTVYIYIHIHIHIYIHISFYTYIYIHIYIHISSCGDWCGYVSVCVCVLCVSVLLRDVRISVFFRSYMVTGVCVCVLEFVCLSVCLCVLCLCLTTRCLNDSWLSFSDLLRWLVFVRVFWCLCVCLWVLCLCLPNRCLNKCLFFRPSRWLVFVCLCLCFGVCMPLCVIWCLYIFLLLYVCCVYDSITKCI